MIEVDQEIINELLDNEHAERIDDLKIVAAITHNVDDLERRLAREAYRYEQAKAAFRLYNLSVEEWEDEVGIDDPAKYHHWRNYI